MQEICKCFPVTEPEFRELDKKFGNLCEYAGWQLIRKNNRNNHTEDQEDVAQELRLALLRAGSYYKRQVYIEACLELCGKYAKHGLLEHIARSLQDLWDNKTRHGASKQKFGFYQEELLETLVNAVVPASERPSKDEPLHIDSKFSTYCKAIAWNAQKSMGKKITREKTLRGTQVSLSEYSYLGSMEEFSN